MKLDLLEKSGHHKEICTSCAWAGGELFTCSDDKTILKWSQDGEMIAEVATVDAYATSIAFAPEFSKSQRPSIFALSCADGTVRYFNLSTPTRAREEKVVKAHTGAVISVKWNPDGTSLMSAGEDGDLKVWSKSGHLRSTLAQGIGGGGLGGHGGGGHGGVVQAVYAFVWGPDGDAVLWASGKTLNLKSQSGSGRKALSWVAHGSLVTCVDWNRINGLVVSGGEDCTYKVWDEYGRLVYGSGAGAHVVTSVAWRPNGDAFAVGSFHSLRLCDKAGWSHSRERPCCGSVVSLAWTADGTEVAGSGGSGAVVFGMLVDRQAEWRNLEVVVVEPKLMHVVDSDADGAYERLEFPRDRVVEFGLGWGYLVAATATQCSVYATSNWNTPHMFDLRTPVNLVVLAPHFFLLMDSQAITVYSYEGRVVSSPRFNGLKPPFLDKRSVALCDDAVAVLDRTDSKTIRCFDTATGRSLGPPIAHKAEIVQLSLSQCGSGGGVGDRRLLVLDKNRDLHLCPVVPQPGIFRGMYKLQTQVDTAAWCDSCDMAACVADTRLVVWSWPGVAFVDRDLLAHTSEHKDAAHLGKASELVSLSGARAVVRRSDGATVAVGTDQGGYCGLLHAMCREKKWDEATRLCRFVKDGEGSKRLWGVLAGMALQARHLDTAEVALAALVEVDKLDFISHVKSKVPSEEGKAAELALYRRCPDEAEAILLQAKPPLLYRALKMNLRLFRWGRALELALKHKKHIDTVLGYRQRHLERTGQTETLGKFVQYNAQVAVDWQAVKAKIANEKDDERARAGYGPSAGSERK